MSKLYRDRTLEIEGLTDESDGFGKTFMKAWRHSTKPANDEPPNFAQENGEWSAAPKFDVDPDFNTVLTPPTPKGFEADPVAFRYRWKLEGEWTSWRVSDASQKSAHLRGLEEEPLYTRDQIRAAEAKAAHWEMHYKTKTHLARREALEEAAQIAFDYNGRSPSDGRCIADRIRIRALAEKESK